MQTSATQVASGPAVASADPGSTNLAAYLGALGLNVKPETVAQWVTLVPVLALELGSALAGLLVASVSPAKVSLSHAKTEGAEGTVRSEATKKDKVASAIVDHLRANGGAIRGSHRRLGSQLGHNRNTVNRALHSLAASGVVALSSSKAGSVVTLAS